MGVLLFGMSGYSALENNFLNSLYSSIRLLILELDADGTLPWQLEVARFLAVAFGIILVIRAILTVVDKSIFLPLRMYLKSDHTIVYGLTPITVPYLKSIKTNHSDTVIIEPDQNNPHIAEFDSKDMEIITHSFEDSTLLDDLNIINSKHIFIASNNDIDNINIATTYIEFGFENAKTLIKNKKQISLIIHIVNKELFTLFEKSIADTIEQKHLNKTDKLTEKALQDLFDIRMVSYYKEVAKDLLRNYPIDAKKMTLLNTDQEITLVLIGQSETLLAILEEIFKQAHFPNNNKIRVVIITQDSLAAKEIVNRHFFSWEKDTKFILEFISQDPAHKCFFNLDIWGERDQDSIINTHNITNIYLTSEDELENLKLAMNINEHIYLHADEEEKPKILFFLKEQKRFGSYIDDNNKAYNAFESFGRINKVLSNDNLINQHHEDMAKLIRYTKSETLDLNKEIEWESINYKWKESSTDERSRSRAQASHIKIKLHSLGLDRSRELLEGYSVKKLYKQNSTIFEGALVNLLGADEYESVKNNYRELEKLLKDRTKYELPEFLNNLSVYNGGKQTVFDKLTAAEHSRWCMHHWINGWSNNSDLEIKDDESKKHNCLTPLCSVEDSKRVNVYYAWESILMIPLYCSVAGYKIEEINSQSDSLLV